MRATKSHFTTASFIAIATLAELGGASAARAETPTQQTTAAVKELVITAERRVENLESTPIAASVLTGQQVQAKNIQTVNQLETAVPSLTVSNGGQSNYMNIRGIGKNDNSGNTTSAVATYRDGVPTVSGFFNGEPYYDISSVEVLRGPQGTFVGENAAGGAIFVNTEDPRIGGGYSGWAELGYGAYNRFEAEGALNIPVNDQFAARIAFDHSNRDSFYQVFMDPARTIRNPNNVGAQDLNSARLGMLWKPVEPLSIKLKIDVNDLDYHGNAYSVLPGLPNTRGLNLSNDLFVIGNNIIDNYYVDKSFRSALEVKYQLPNGITLRSISGGQYIDSFLRNDDDGSVILNPAAPPGSTVTNQQNIQAIFRVFSEELAAISPTTGRFNWIVGAYYHNEDLRFPPIKPDLSNGFVLFNTPNRAIELTLVWNTRRITEAAFGQASYNLTDKLQLQLGLRYSHYRVSQVSDLGLPAPLPTLINAEQDNALTGKAALNYQLDPDNFLYAFAATGHTTGGVNVVNFFGLIPTTFGPQETTDYEAGWKGKLLDDRLHLQVGGYYEDIRHYQATFAIQGSGLDLPFFRTLDSPSTTYGLEATAQAVFGDFSADSGLSLARSRLGHAVIFDGFQNIDVTGHRMPYAPNFMFNLGAQYDFHLPDDATLTPRVDFSWTGVQTSNLLDRTFNGFAVDRVPAHEMLNAELTYARPGSGWRITLYGTNLTNIHYIQAVGGGGDNAYANDPRQYGVRVYKRF